MLSNCPHLEDEKNKAWRGTIAKVAQGHTGNGGTQLQPRFPTPEPVLLPLCQIVSHGTR